MPLYLHIVSCPICSAMALYLYTVLYIQCYGSVSVNSVISVVLRLCISIESHTVPHVNFYGCVSVYSVISVVLRHSNIQCHICSVTAFQYTVSYL